MEYLATIFKCYQSEPPKICFLMFLGALAPGRYDRQIRNLTRGKSFIKRY